MRRPARASESLIGDLLIDERFAIAPKSTFFPPEPSSIPMPTPSELIDRLDSRHDELIRKLDELNAHIEKALAEVYQKRAANTRDALTNDAPQVAQPLRRAA
jgi:hypothetical protein